MTWMGGSSTVGSQGGQPGIYNTAGSTSGNIPGGRYSAAFWTDNNGQLWLYGGEGFDGQGHYGHLNDLWRLNPASGWTCAASRSAYSASRNTRGPGIPVSLLSKSRWLRGEDLNL